MNVALKAALCAAATAFFLQIGSPARADQGQPDGWSVSTRVDSTGETVIDVAVPHAIYTTIQYQWNAAATTVQPLVNAGWRLGAILYARPNAAAYLAGCMVGFYYGGVQNCETWGGAAVGVYSQVMAVTP